MGGNHYYNNNENDANYYYEEDEVEAWADSEEGVRFILCHISYVASNGFDFLQVPS